MFESKIRLGIIFVGALLSANYALACHTCPGYSGCFGWCPYPGPPNAISEQGLTDVNDHGLIEELNAANGTCDTCSPEAKEKCSDFETCTARNSYNPDTGHSVCGYSCE